MSDIQIETALRTARSTNAWEDWQQAARLLYRANRHHEANALLSRAAQDWRSRNDPHRPSVIQPQDYKFVLAIDYGPCVSPRQQQARARLMELKRSTPFFAKENGRGQCDICGAWWIHGAVFQHIPSGDHIQIGWICADKLEMVDAEAFQAKEQSFQHYHAERAARKRWSALRVTAANLPKDVRAALRVDHEITRNIRRRFIQYQTLSQAQCNLLLRLKNEVENPPEEEVHVPAPEGRQEIRGRVVSIKDYESAYGYSLKMTVKVVTDDGVWLCWGTVPSSIARDLTRGDEVTFTGTLKQGNDPHFAFFSRPTCASIVPQSASV